MKPFSLKRTISLILMFSVLGFFSCDETASKPPLKVNLESHGTSISDSSPDLSQDFKDYWYSGEAEITSFSLEQARYGELRNGHAVLIYVTEDFRPDLHVKADRSNPDNVSVLKLNATKKFNTGIYPYSIMQSTFYPVSNDQHAIKVTSSMQEWCGHVYTQLNNRSNFEVSSFSYFESESDQNLKLDKTILENELWAQIRIDPSSLPQGEFQLIPSFEFLRFKHIEIKPYKATTTLTDNSYSIDYLDLERTITITFNPEFPYEIQGWQETFRSGFGPDAKILTTKATRLKTLKSAYWGKNRNSDDYLRETLQLK